MNAYCAHTHTDVHIKRAAGETVARGQVRRVARHTPAMSVTRNGSIQEAGQGKAGVMGVRVCVSGLLPFLISEDSQQQICKPEPECWRKHH